MERLGNTVARWLDIELKTAKKLRKPTEKDERPVIAAMVFADTSTPYIACKWAVISS